MPSACPPCRRCSKYGHSRYSPSRYSHSKYGQGIVSIALVSIALVSIAISVPSVSQIKLGMGWLGQPSATAPTHASLLDEYLQVKGAVVVVLVVVLVVVSGKW